MSKAPAVDYALDIIELFANSNTGLGITDISNSLGINKNAVSRVLEALHEKNWIYMYDTSQKKYMLTMRPYSVIARYACDHKIAKIACSYLEELNNDLGDSTYLGIKNGRNVLYLSHFDSKKEVRINGCAGSEYPLNCSAPGKILLSYSDEEEIRNFFSAPIDKRTENTIVDFDGFMQEAKKIKESGYAIDNEEFAKGIYCIAAPIFDYWGNAVAAIGISTLTIYDNVDSLVNKKFASLKKAANEISRCLGNK